MRQDFGQLSPLILLMIYPDLPLGDVDTCVVDVEAVSTFDPGNFREVPASSLTVIYFLSIT